MPKTEHVCKNSSCGKAFLRYPSQIRDEKSCLCSKKCRNEMDKIRFKGKGNPNYKNGKHLDIVCTCGREKDFRALQCAHCSKRGFPKKNVKNERINRELIEKIVRESNSYESVGNRLGMSRTTASSYIKKLKIDIGHFRPGRGRLTPACKLFIKSVKRNGTIKPFIIKNGILPYKCANCNQKPFWKGKSLTLQLHHKNGNSADNIIKNLCFLCPNCHSQTNTFTGRKKGRRQ